LAKNEERKAVAKLLFKMLRRQATQQEIQAAALAHASACPAPKYVT
jgi:hypothetical protein